VLSKEGRRVEGIDAILPAVLSWMNPMLSGDDIAVA
jgi:hypothetical protein